MEQLTKADILEHWPFVAVLLILMIVMQVVKTSVFTKLRAYGKGKMQWFWWWGYKCLPLYSIIAGAVIGCVWADPEPSVSGIASVFYFASAGTLSVWAYEVLKGLAKKRDIDLTLPGQASPTVPPEENKNETEKSS